MSKNRARQGKKKNKSKSSQAKRNRSSQKKNMQLEEKAVVIEQKEAEVVTESAPIEEEIAEAPVNTNEEIIPANEDNDFIVEEAEQTIEESEQTIEGLQESIEESAEEIEELEQSIEESQETVQDSETEIEDAVETVEEAVETVETVAEPESSEAEPESSVEEVEQEEPESSVEETEQEEPESSIDKPEQEEPVKLASVIPHKAPENHESMDVPDQIETIAAANEAASMRSEDNDVESDQSDYESTDNGNFEKDANAEDANAEDTIPPYQEEYSDEQAAPEKRHTGLKAAALLMLLLVYSAAFIYGIFQVEKIVVSPDKFHRGTYINDVDVSGMDTEKATQALTDKWNKRSISILDSNGAQVGEIGNFTFKYDIEDQLINIMRPGAEKAIVNFVTGNRKDYVVNMTPAKNTKSFKKQFEKLSIVENAMGDKMSKNAYIDKSDTEFRIVKEVIGNSVDTVKLRKAIFEAIARGEDTFQYRRDSFYKAPDIISTSKVLLEEREYCKKYLSFKIRLRNSVNDYTITPAWLDEMIKIKEDGKVKVNDEKVDQFISDVLYPKFSSTGDTRRLTSAGGGKYTISGGTYGFTIDTEKEKSKIKAELKDREDVEREPYYSGKKPNQNGASDIGDTFIEVSIKKQRVWLVKNGKTIVDTPVVTGNVPRHNTPTGVYYIVYKATNTTLKGHNDDGSEYESHVAYWMPFYLGYGLHDASWRGVFGGSIYIGNGSHGCVNCPPAIMPKIFKNSYAGMPVIVH